MNYIFYLLFPFLLNNSSLHLSNTSMERAQAKDSTELQLFSAKNYSYRASSNSNKALSDYTLMKLDKNSIQSIRDKDLSHFKFLLPYKNGNLHIELNAVQLFDGNFRVITDKSNGVAIPYQPGKYYSGKINGDPNSIVSLSVFENQVYGILSSSELGNMNLGKNNSSDPMEYILYKQQDGKIPVDFECSTAENDNLLPIIQSMRPQIEKQLESRAAGCVTIDFELTLEVYSYFSNSTTAAANWMTALFAGVKTLYANESIEMNIKTIFVWTTEDGYSDNVSSALGTLINRRINDANYTANFVHLVRGRTCNQSCSLAGVAYVNALCNSSYRFGVSEPLFEYNAYPNYSWSINVITHELGHNMGSNHTHWCGWSGGPIDNCVAQEGSCSPGPRPAAGGGTIMSYCHQISTVGIRFSNGFGPQPGNVIRSVYNSANCLSTSCGGTGGTPTCSDGIQNGTETGIDCGGSCAPCNTGPCPSPVNISQGKTATQSSTVSPYTASKLNDGSNSTFNHTNSETQPWWQVDLGTNHTVTSIEIRNRADCCGNRIKKFKVFVSAAPITDFSTSGSVYEYNTTAGMTNGQAINIPNINRLGRYVKVWVDNTSGANPMHLAEVRVMGCVSLVDPCLDNDDPTISISSNETYTQGGSFTVNANVSDDGTISKVDFFNGASLLGSDATAPYSFTVNPANDGSYSISAVVTDNCNESVTSNLLSLTGVTSCTDGIKNGTESGVDCGGTCSACPQGCITSINVSQGKTASQSSTLSATYAASKTNDGNNTNFSHTNSELKPWWEVDLGGNYFVTSLEIRNRTDCCGGRIKKFRIFVSSSPVSDYNSGGYVYEYNNSAGLAVSQILNVPGLTAAGRYVRIWVDNGTVVNPLHLAEVRVMGCQILVDPCLNNQLPTISINSASTSFIQESSFTINATAADNGGSINSVSFYNGVNLLGSDDSAPFSWTINPASASLYTITAVALDNCNTTAVSNLLTFTGTSSCSDGVRNGTETGVDCGGSCTACPQVCTTSVNVSQGKTSSLSSTLNATYAASKTNDGNNTTFCHTNSETQPWWEVDLGSNHSVKSIEVRNRADCCGNRLKKFRIFVTSTPVSSYSTSGFVFEYNNPPGAANGQIITISNLTANGRYVRIWVDNGSTANPLHLAEVRVMGCALTGTINQSFNGTNTNPIVEEPKFKVKIYPNPAHHFINFEFPYILNDEVHAKIYDINGRLLIKARVNDNKLDISSLDNGSYVLRIQAGDKEQIHKILKF